MLLIGELSLPSSSVSSAMLPILAALSVQMPRPKKDVVARGLGGLDRIEKG